MAAGLFFLCHGLSCAFPSVSGFCGYVSVRFLLQGMAVYALFSDLVYAAAVVSVCRGGVFGVVRNLFAKC